MTLTWITTHLLILDPLLALLYMTKALVFLCQTHLRGDVLCGPGERGTLLDERAGGNAWQELLAETVTQARSALL